MTWVRDLVTGFRVRNLVRIHSEGDTEETVNGTLGASKFWREKTGGYRKYE